MIDPREIQWFHSVDLARLTVETCESHLFTSLNVKEF